VRRARPGARRRGVWTPRHSTRRGGVVFSLPDQKSAVETTPGASSRRLSPLRDPLEPGAASQGLRVRRAAGAEEAGHAARDHPEAGFCRELGTWVAVMGRTLSHGAVPRQCLTLSPGSRGRPGSRPRWEGRAARPAETEARVGARQPGGMAGTSPRPVPMPASTCVGGRPGRS
jgi:hypothetical protein